VSSVSPHAEELPPEAPPDRSDRPAEGGHKKILARIRHNPLKSPNSEGSLLVPRGEPRLFRGLAAHEERRTLSIR